MSPPKIQALGITQEGSSTRWRATGYVDGVGWQAAWGTSLIEAVEALQALTAHRVAERGENPRAEDMDINVCREKKLTNMRSSTSDELERLARPRLLGLEEALEFCSVDECVEVAPDVVRVRKVVLDATQRARQRARDRMART